MRRRSHAAAVVAACLAYAVFGDRVRDAAAQDALTAGAVEDREWEQLGGDATHACASTVAPILTEPVVAWRRPLPGDLLAEPVSWNGVVYVVARNRNGRDLLAYRIATGEQVGATALGDGSDPVELAVWQSVAVVGEPQRVRGFPLKPDGFSMGWTMRSDPSGAGTLRTFGPMTLSGGVAFIAAEPGRIGVVQVSNGRRLGVVSTGATSLTRPVVIPADEGLRILLPGTRRRPNYAKDHIRIGRFEVSGLGRAQIASNELDEWSPVAAVDSAPDRKTWTAWIDPPKSGDASAHPGLLVTGTRIARRDGGSTPACIIHGATLNLCEIALRPAVRNGTFYGFTARGDLVRVDTSGSYWDLVDLEHMPKGARPGHATLARNVLHFGNWAADADTKRVLWCLPSIVPRSSAIPVADGRLVVATNDGALVCLADAAGVAPTTATADPAADGAAPRPRSPADLEGVILGDGTRIDGKAEPDEGGGFRVVSAGGETRAVARDDVSLAVAAGAVLLHGEEFGAFAAWDAFLRAACADAFEDLARKAAGERLQTRVRRLVAEARSYGLSDARAQQIDQLLAGFSEVPNAADKEPRHRKAEDDVRERLAAQCLEGAQWLEDRMLPVAATGLLGLADTVRPGLEATADRAETLIPPGFPWRTDNGAGRLWISWAREILPAGAAFLVPGDPALRRLQGPPWLSGTIGLRTRNLLLFTRSTDPAIVGPCLRNGEGAVRALDVLLQDGKPHPVVSDGDRLEVRLHANKKDYMDERPPSGGGAMSWSAGYYSPSENVSRFYLPDANENEAARGRTLFKVLAHELTHHYIEQRHVPGKHGGAATPGYWVVEGMARFVEDQAVEMGRRGLRFDDSTAESLDLASQLDAKGALLLPLGRFVDLSHALSYSLSTERTVEVKLRNTLSTYEISALDVFYNQAGSLCFWLMHRRGPEGRAALLSYLRAHYGGRTTPDGWRALGFTDAAAMEREFRAFLAELRK